MGDETVSSATGEIPVIHDRYVIDPQDPQPALNAGPITAFAVHDQKEPDRRLFAYICKPELPFRVHALTRLRRATPPNLLPLVDAGTVYWPPANRRCLAIVYEKPLGGSLAIRFRGTDQQAWDHEIIGEIVSPILSALRGLEDLGFAHRGIRADNVYAMDEAGTNFALGDCVTVPAGYAQPDAMEPIERAMADRAGRGEGSVADDFYALGAMLLELFVGLPDEPFTDSLLTAKANNGSFAALCDRHRFSSAITELFKGLLADDPERRWGFGQVERWLAGQSRSQSVGGGGPIVQVPFVFAGHSYTSVRLLAHAMSQDVRSAASVAKSGTLKEWLVRSASSEAVARMVSDAVTAQEAARGTQFGTDDYLITRIAAALDPQGPVRYCGFRYMPDGFGPAFAARWLLEDDLKTPSAAMSLGLAEPIADPEAPPARRRSLGADQSLAKMVSQPGYGYGPERCLYHTNPGLACRSPIVINAHALAGDSLLSALEVAAETLGPDGMPMDRHLAAFIAARADTNLGPVLKTLNEPDPNRTTLAALSVLATLQSGRRVTPTPRLALWFAKCLDDVVENFRSRSTRETLRRQLPRIAERGRLSDILNMLDSPKRRYEDKKGLEAAAAEYAAAEATIRTLVGNKSLRAYQSRQLGQQTAATISFVIGITVSWAVLMAHLW